MSVSSIRMINGPGALRANSQLKMAVRTLPTCKCPVGLGAKRTRMFETMSSFQQKGQWRRFLKGAQRNFQSRLAEVRYAWRYLAELRARCAWRHARQIDVPLGQLLRGNSAAQTSFDEVFGLRLGNARLGFY